jgi:hypothetical protein
MNDNVDSNGTPGEECINMRMLIPTDANDAVDNQQQTCDERWVSVLQSNVSTNSPNDMGLYDSERIHTGVGVGSELCFDRRSINSSYPKLKSNRISFIRRLFVAGDNSGIMDSGLESCSGSFACWMLTTGDYSGTVATSNEFNSVSFNSRLFTDSWISTVTTLDERDCLDATRGLRERNLVARRSSPFVHTAINRDGSPHRCDTSRKEGYNGPD